QKRAVIWQNGDDYLLAVFHPNAEAGGRLQMKEFRPKSGANAFQGEPSDTKFLREFPPVKEKDDEPVGPFIEVKSTDLAQEYKDKCTGGGVQQTFVALEHCRLEGTGPNTTVAASAAEMLATYKKNADAGNAKFRDKEVTILNAVFVSVNDDLAVFNDGQQGGT